MTLLSKWSKFNDRNLCGSHRIYKSMPTLFLDRRAAKALIRMADVINVVEEPYGMCGEGKGKMPAKKICSLNMVISAG